MPVLGLEEEHARAIGHIQTVVYVKTVAQMSELTTTLEQEWRRVGKKHKKDREA